MYLIKLKMIGESDRHRGKADKPNEDAYLLNEPLGLAIIADGVSQTRNRDGIYPASTSTIAPTVFVKEVESTFLRHTSCSSSHEAMSEAVREANKAIWEVNVAHGIVEKVNFKTIDYLGTVGCAIWVYNDAGATHAVIGSIGDSLAFYLPKDADARLITRDQLHACHRFSKPFFERMAIAENLSPAEMKRRRLLWQRTRARNKISAKDPDGNAVGFGVMTGEPGALDFLDITTINDIQPGDQFLLATDAIRACTACSNEPETVQSYKALLTEMRQYDPDEWPHAIIERIRQREVDSDDATVVLVRVL